MDVISLGKAKKAQQAIQKLNDRLGVDGTEQGEDVKGGFSSLKERLEELEKQDPGITLYNRVSDLEKHTHINLNKHNLRVASLLNQKRYYHTDMIVDDFADDSGIDQDLSTGHAYYADEKKISMAEGETQAEVVTIAEEIEKPPQNVVVSLASNEQNLTSNPVDLDNGAYTDVEFVDGKILLKQVGEVNLGYTDNLAPLKNSANIKSYPWKISGHPGEVNLHFLFDRGSGTRAGNTSASQVPAYILIDTGVEHEVQITKLSLTTFSGYGWPANWRFEASETGEFNGEEIILYKNINEPKISENATVEFSFSNEKAFQFYRIYASTTYGSGSLPNGNRLEFREIEAYGPALIQTYVSEGTYETPIIVLGENFKSLYKVESLLDIPEGTEAHIFTSTSSNGLSFSGYLPLNTDGTIASPAGRYIKIKAELIGSGETQERVIHEFTEEEKTDFEENEFVVFEDSAAKLKTTYEYQMEVDSSFTGSGTLLRASIHKGSFKNVEKVEVALP